MLKPSLILFIEKFVVSCDDVPKLLRSLLQVRSLAWICSAWRSCNLCLNKLCLPPGLLDDGFSGGNTGGGIAGCGAAGIVSVENLMFFQSYLLCMVHTTKVILAIGFLTLFALGRCLRELQGPQAVHGFFRPTLLFFSHILIRQEGSPDFQSYVIHRHAIIAPQKKLPVNLPKVEP